MPYYGRGDYYAGRFRGDPGLWDWVKKGAKVALGFATGGPLGAARAALPSGPGGTTVSIQPPQIGPVRLGPSIQVESYRGYRGSVDVPASDGACPRGFHPAKDGSGRCVRNRRMNVTNPSALRRAIRREEGFIQLAKRFNLRPPPKQRPGSGLKTKRKR